MSGKSMVSNGTSSESPYEDEENSYKNSQYILEVKESQEIRTKTEHILNHLQKEGIIKNPKIDRYDTKIVNDTDKSHYHFFYDLQGVNNKGSHNTLTKIINDYVESGTINNKLINKIKGDILKKNTITQKGILDTRHEGYNLTLQQKKLLKDNIENFYYINKRGDKLFNFEHIEQDKALKGMSGTDKPINLIEGNNVKSLQGQYDYTFHFDKDLSNWEMEEELETKLKEQILKSGGSVEDFKGYDFDLSKITITQKDNTINIKMNNLFKGVDSNNFYMVSSKNMKLILESTFKEVEKELDLNLNYRNRFYKDIEDINELMLDKSSKGTQLKTEPEPVAAQTVEQPLEEEKTIEQIKPLEKVEKTVKPIQNDYLELSLEEVERDLKELNEVLKETERFRKFGLINEDKLELMEQQKQQLEEVLEIKIEEQRLVNLEIQVEEQTKIIDNLVKDISSKDTEITKLSTDLTTKTELVEVLETEVKEIEEELETYSKENKKLKIDIVSMEEDLEVKDNEIVDLESKVKRQSKTIEVLEKDIENRDNNISIHKKNIKKLETDLTSKDTEIESLKSEVSNLKGMQEDVIKERHQDREIYKNDISSKNEEIETLKLEIEEYEEDRIERNSQDKENDIQLRKEIGELKEQLEESQKKIVELEEEGEEIDFSTSRPKTELDLLEQELEEIDTTEQGTKKGTKPPKK